MKNTHCIIMVILTAAILSGTSAAHAEEGNMAREKTHFRRLILQRNRLHSELRNLDRKAAETVKNGENPVGTYSQQVTTQDKLDLIQLNLETKAIRYGFDIPDLPQEKPAAAEQSDNEQSSLRTGSTAFARGRQRTKDELKAQTLELMSSIDFSKFLAKVGKE